MEPERKRGLSALLQSTSTGFHATLKPQEVLVSLIRSNPLQPRKEFKEDALQELSESIKANGILQPILVRQLSQAEIGLDPQRYEIVAGERRWRAAQRALLSSVPVVVSETNNPQEVLILSMIENLQRDDLNPMDEAEAYSKLRNAPFSMTQEQISSGVGKSRTHIANALRLLDLPQSVRNAVRSGALSVGHAKVLAGIPDSNLQTQLAAKCQAEGLSVRQLELFALGKESLARAKYLTVTSKIGGAERNPHVKKLEEQLSKFLGTRVRIEEGAKKGRITIEFYNVDDFDRITSLMGLTKS